MAEIRVNFGDDDRENEQFLGFNLDNIEEAEERYIRQLDVLLWRITNEKYIFLIFCSRKHCQLKLLLNITRGNQGSY
jgi:hypothetical protein